MPITLTQLQAWMLEECVRQSKPFPDYSRSDANQVWLTLGGEIQDESFLRFIERIGPEPLDSFDPHDFLLLGLLARGQRIPAALQPRLPRLIELGLLERIARGKVILSRKLYEPARRVATVARKREQAREGHKALLLTHLLENPGGSALKELRQVLPALSADQVHRLMKELRAQGLVQNVGATRASRWLPTELARQRAQERNGRVK